MISLARPSWLKTAIRASGRKMSSSAAPLLVTPTQLLDLTKSGNVSLLDASWYMPNSPRKPREEFQSKRVQGANFLDLDEVASPNDLGLKHMIPEERIFANACDGGLPRWSAEGLPVETKPPGDVAKSEYATPTLDKDAIRSNGCHAFPLSSTHKSKSPRLSANCVQLKTDAALGSNGRVCSRCSFTRPTHKTADSSYTTFLPPDEIRQALVDAVGPAHAQAIISGERSIVATCGSGMTAGVLWLGLRLLGVQNPGLYDEVSGTSEACLGRDTLLVQRA
ncbi:hypothetical protein HWV62_30362 [Athelia sp. TMB]|nr:hypothetical protein HWV62_30362 [Athelia sp. TMB]